MTLACVVVACGCVCVKSLLRDITCRGRLVAELAGRKAEPPHNVTGISRQTDVSLVKTRYDSLLAATQVESVAFFLYPVYTMKLGTSLYSLLTARRLSL